MNTMILALCSIYQLSLSEILFGSHGQNCGNNDNPPDSCPFLEGRYHTSLIDTVIECDENYECCTCASITCGTVGGPYCDRFVAEGDSAAFGVYPITVTGDPGDGVSIECSGDSTCEGTHIYGTDIKDVKCDGDRACAVSWFNIVCVSNGCNLECDGESSCSSASFVLRNSTGITCSDNACEFTSILLWPVIAGNIECDGDHACSNSIISAFGPIEMTICGDDFACKDSQIGVWNPSPNYEVQCKGVGSCQGLYVYARIERSSSITHLNGIDCETEESCKNLIVWIHSDNVLTIDKINCGAQEACKDAKIWIYSAGVLTIKELNCEAEAACNNAEFKFYGNVIIEQCKCGDNGCEGATGIEFCH